MQKVWMIGVAVATAMAARAEPMRPFYTRENRQPERFQLEAGVSYDYSEKILPFGPSEFSTATAQIRYGLASELTLNVGVPFVTRTAEGEDSASGIGDVRVGLTLRAWEDIFGFPYLIPYAEAAFPAADKYKWVGEADPWFVVGVAFGTTVHDKLHYALDISGRILPDDESNVASYRGALIYDLSQKTSILVEGEFSNRRDYEPEDRILLLGGLTYKPTRNWMVGFHGGGQLNDDNGSGAAVAAVKVIYTFHPFVF